MATGVAINGAVLAELRLLRGLTQQTMADACQTHDPHCGIDRDRISGYEREKLSPGMVNLLVIRAVLDHALPLADREWRALIRTPTLDTARNALNHTQENPPAGPFLRSSLPAMNVAVEDVDSPVVASQQDWLSVRRYLNRHRAELARIAARLYPPELCLAGTPLLARPEWIPARPVDLDNIKLGWVEGRQPQSVDGTQPEAARLLPLRAADYRYDRYTSAVRYLDSPTLFENRPSYRLLDVGWADDGGRMSFGLAAYFDKLDVSEALGHEFAEARLRLTGADGRVSDMGWRRLPFRRIIGDSFDMEGLPVIPAVTTLTLCRNRVAGTAAFLLHWRNPGCVATAGGLYDVIPAGEFQPSSVAPWDQVNDFDLWRNIVREFSEELLGTPEHDGSRSTPIEYENWPFYRALERARASGQLGAFCLGVGVDALTLAATILTVVVIDDDVFEKVFGEIVRANAEGVTVTTLNGQSSASGIPFAECNVRRLLTSEPMASPGAACIALAWRHRDVLLRTSPRAG